MSDRGDQPQAGGQPTNQPQGGAAQQGAQGGYTGQPVAGQEGIVEALQRPNPKSYLQAIIGSMAVGGALLGIGVFLVSEIGGRPILPDIVQSVQMEQIDQAISATHQLTLAYVANELAIFLAFVMAPVFGGLVALRMDDTARAKVATSGVGVGIGALLFVILVSFIASMAVPSTSDFMAAAQTSPVGGVGGAEAAFGLGSVNFSNLVINGVLFGIVAGLGASATTYFLDGTDD